MATQTLVSITGTAQLPEPKAAPTIEAFVSLVRAGADSWQAAGVMLVKLVREDKNVMLKITDAHPFITLDTLEIFHSIGTRSLHPLSVLLPRQVFSRVRSMSYQAQVKVCTSPVEVVTRMSGDLPVVIRKGVAKLTAKEARNALCSSGQRPVKEQIKMLTKVNVEELLPKKELPPAIRLPKLVALYTVRRSFGGQFAFEKTTARPYTLQKVTLTHGQAVIELCEYEGEP